MGTVSIDLIERLLADNGIKRQYVELLNAEVARLKEEGTAGLPEAKVEILLDAHAISSPGTASLTRLGRLFGNRQSFTRLLHGEGGFDAARIRSFHELTHADPAVLFRPLLRQLEHDLEPGFEQYLFNYPPVISFRSNLGVTDEDAEMPPFGAVLELRNFLRKHVSSPREQGLSGD